jgi:hypothetical protein
MAASTYTENSQVVLDQKVILGEQYLASYMVTPLAGVSTASANAHLLEIMAGASLNVRIRKIQIYQVTNATTVAIGKFIIFRLSSAGTGGTVVTPAPLDPSDTAAGATAMTLPSAAGSEGAQVFAGSNTLQQTTNVSIPYGPILALDFDTLRTKPLLIPAGAANGICIKNITAIAATTLYINVWITETSF